MKKKLGGAVASLALATAMAFAAPPASAQSTAAGNTDTVQIWGQLEETLAEELSHYGSRVDVVTGEQIRNGGYVDASQALQNLVPGLYVAPKNGPFDYVSASLLGGRRTDIIWLIDGVRISNRLYTTTTPLDTIPAHMIEKIEVLKGGQALFYGTSAVSGVINVITKGFTDETRGQLLVGAGDDEARSISGNVSGSNGGVHWVAYASHDEADGFQPFRDADYDASATDRNRSYDVDTFGLKAGYEFSDTLKVSANYQHTNALLDFAYPSDAYSATNDREEDLLSAKLDWSPTDKLSLFVKAYYHSWDTLYNEIDNNSPPDGTLTVVSDNEFWGFEDYGLNLLAQYKLNPDLTLLGGVDYQNYNGEDQVFLIDKQTEYVIAPFAQVRWTAPVLDGLSLAAGIRHNAPKGDGDATVYNLSGELAINPSLYVRGQVGTSFRLPDAYELFVKDGCCEQGNPDLKPEQAENLELGVGGNIGAGWTWEVTGFRRKIEDYIQIVTVADTRPVGSPGNFGCGLSPAGCYDTFDNEGDPVTTEGAELTVTGKLTDALSLTADWTHTKAEERGSNTQVNDIPKDVAKLLLDWAPADLPFAGGVSVNHIGDVTSRGFPIGDYTTVDLNGRWYLDKARKQRIGVRVENLTDEEYDTAKSGGGIGALGRGRSFFVSYGIDF